MQTFSFYSSVTKTEQSANSDIYTLLAQIKNPNAVIALSNKGYDNAKIKQELPCFTIGGTAKARAKDSYEALSGLLILDFDYKDNPNIDLPAFLHSNLRHDPYIHLGFVSLSGKGIKLVIKYRFKNEIKDTTPAEAYEIACQYAIDYFSTYQISETQIGLVADPTSKNISQAQVINYDKNPAFLDNSSVFEIKNEYVAEAKALKIAKEYERSEVFYSDYNFQTVRNLVNELNEKDVDLRFCNDFGKNTYSTWLAFGYAFYSAFGNEGKELFYDLSSFSSHFKPSEAKASWKTICRRSSQGNPQALNFFFFVCKKNGLQVPKLAVPITYDKSFVVDLTTKYLDDCPIFAEKFWKEYAQFLASAKTILPLTAPTGIGKTSFILRNLANFKQGDRKVYFFAPRLTNTKDVLARAKKIGLFPFVVSSEFSQKSNINENGTDFNSANFIICTYQSFTKMEHTIQDDDVLIFDEFHSITENTEISLKNALFNNKCLCITATPSPFLGNIFGKKLASAIQVKPKYEQRAKLKIAPFQEISEIITYLKSIQGRVLIQADSKEQATYLGKLLADSSVFHSENKSEWYEQLIETQTLPTNKFVITTAVISAGIDILDKDISEVVLIQFGNGQHLHTAQNIVQFANRLRVGKANITLFRNEPKKAGEYNFAKNLKIVKTAVTLYCAEANLNLKHLQDFSEIESNYLGKLAKISNFCTLHKGNYEVNLLAIWSFLEGQNYRKTSNAMLAKELVIYGYDLETFAPASTDSAIQDEYTALKKEKRTADDLKIELAIKSLDSVDSAYDLDNLAKIEPKNLAIKRVKKVQNLLERTAPAPETNDEFTITPDHFKQAKELVIANPDRRSFGDLEKRLFIQYLHTAPKVSPKEQVYKNVLNAFLTDYNKFKCNLLKNENSFNYVDLKAKLKDIFDSSLPKNYKYCSNLFGNPFLIIKELEGISFDLIDRKMIFSLHTVV